MSVFRASKKFFGGLWRALPSTTAVTRVGRSLFRGRPVSYRQTVREDFGRAKNYTNISGARAIRNCGSFVDAETKLPVEADCPLTRHGVSLCGVRRSAGEPDEGGSSELELADRSITTSASADRAETFWPPDESAALVERESWAEIEGNSSEFDGGRRWADFLGNLSDGEPKRPAGWLTRHGGSLCGARGSADESDEGGSSGPELDNRLTVTSASADRGERFWSPDESAAPVEGESWAEIEGNLGARDNASDEAPPSHPRAREVYSRNRRVFRGLESAGSGSSSQIANPLEVLPSIVLEDLPSIVTAERALSNAIVDVPVGRILRNGQLGRQQG